MHIIRGRVVLMLLINVCMYVGTVYGGMYLPPYFFCYNTLFFQKNIVLWQVCHNTLFFETQHIIFQKILCCAPCPQHNIF